MILKSITLENYRPYIGPETIEFAKGEKNITIIQGENDRGKTSLLNAFTWCFYGKEFYRKQGNEPLYNKTAFNNLNSKENLNVKVLIEMEDNNGKIVKFIRSQEFTKSNADIPLSSEPIFEIHCRDGIDEYILQVPENYMNSYLPEELREYFLFDGEQLINLLDNENKNTSLKKGVYTLSQLDLLDKAIDHIKRYKTTLNNELKKINPNAAEKHVELDKLKENENKDKNSLNKNEKEINRLRRSIEVKQREIKEYGENPNILQANIENYESTLEELSKELSKNEEDTLGYLINNFNFIMSLPAFDDFLLSSQELVEKKYIPAPFKKDFLKDLLKDKKCICGTEFTEDSDCYKELVKLFENTDEVTNLSDDVNTLKGKTMKNINSFPDNFKNELKEFKIHHNNLENDFSHYNQLLSAEKSKLNKLNVEDINKLTAKIDRYRTNITKLNEHNGVLKRNLVDYPNKIKELEIEIEKEENLTKKHKMLLSKKSFCEEAMDNLQNIKKDLSRDIHDQLQQITTEEFKNIHWKESYQEVLIDENFEISFKKEDGSFLTSTDPSSGTQLVLALSFMVALNSLSGFKLPLIIDTPLSRLDSTVRGNIADYLPMYLKDKQLTLMVTSTEYTGEFKNKIKKFVGKEYTLQYFNDDGEYTRVI